MLYFAKHKVSGRVVSANSAMELLHVCNEAHPDSISRASLYRLLQSDYAGWNRADWDAMKITVDHIGIPQPVASHFNHHGLNIHSTLLHLCH